jgi:hypothetical protein
MAPPLLEMIMTGISGVRTCCLGWEGWEWVA